MKKIFLIFMLLLSGCSFLLCGDRGVEKYWTPYGVKCSGDVLCNGKYTQPQYCEEK